LLHKRKFVIEKKDAAGGAVFIDYIKFQLVQDKCDLINESFMSEEVRVSFNIKGNRWERDGKVNYFTNLDAWKIEKVSGLATERPASPGVTLEDFPQDNDELGDLPF